MSHPYPVYDQREQVRPQFLIRSPHLKSNPSSRDQGIEQCGDGSDTNKPSKLIGCDDLIRLNRVDTVTLAGTNRPIADGRDEPCRPTNNRFDNWLRPG